MDPTMIALRVVHVGTGVFWAGTVLFLTVFLEPSLRALGPAAAAVSQQLQRLRYFTIMPVIAALTLVSGFWMYWRISNGDTAFLGSRTGMALGVGGALTVIAFVVGVAVLRPAMVRMGTLAAQAQGAQGPERDALMARVETMRVRTRVIGRLVAAMLALIVVTMAIARYV